MSLLLGSGACLFLCACPQLLTDDFRDGAISGADPVLDASTPTTDSRDAGLVPPASDASLSPPVHDAGGDASSPPNGADASSPTPVDTLRAALAHRYDLDGIGTAATDSVAGADGYIYNASLDGQGFVGLSGDDAYVSLPNGLLSSGNDRTFEAWLTWRGGLPWQRVFDFGSSDGQGSGVSYLFLTAASGSGPLFVAYSQSGITGEVALNGTEALPIGTLAHVAVVVDSAHDALSLYLNGALNATTTLTQRLSSLTDFNLWIGRSQFQGDPRLDADVTEFRIYDQALDANQVSLSYQLGPDSPLTNMP